MQAKFLKDETQTSVQYLTKEEGNPKWKRPFQGLFQPTQLKKESLLGRIKGVEFRFLFPQFLIQPGQN